VVNLFAIFVRDVLNVSCIITTPVSKYRY